MKALRVEMEGTVTSFRYPHLHVGRQPSYPMPPPATIYGHVCSALGEWGSPNSIRFGYSFFHNGAGDDLELLHMAAVGTGRMDKTWGYVRNIEVQTNVLPREILLHPKLILYLDASDKTEYLSGAFRSPQYPVLLGRSQDLAAYRTVEIVELEHSEFGYFENTLLPWMMRDRVPGGTTFQMPKFIDPQSRHSVIWERYVVIERRLWWPGKGIKPPKGAKLALPHEGDGAVWVDPQSSTWGQGHRIVMWHSWT
ncbi:MAG TPA: CRISPR-associated protein Cas5 [Acidobacteriota bacterium]|jgi:CRISPR-associated protein Cas5t